MEGPRSFWPTSTRSRALVKTSSRMEHLWWRHSWWPWKRLQVSMPRSGEVTWMGIPHCWHPVSSPGSLHGRLQPTETPSKGEKYGGSAAFHRQKTKEWNKRIHSFKWWFPQRFGEWVLLWQVALTWWCTDDTSCPKSLIPPIHFCRGNASMTLIL